MRHENGNCMPAGGFCTAVNNPICEALHNAYDTGRRAVDVAEVRAEAIKELAERLVVEKYYTGNPTGYGTYAVMLDTINKIAEKMMEANNG